MTFTLDWQTHIIFFTRVFIFIVFIVSAFSKFRDMNAFTKTISSFKLLPYRLIKPTAWAFALLELAVVCGVTIGEELLPISFALAFFLLTLFTGALISVLVRGIRTSCNCFGSSQRNVSTYHVGRNISIILIPLLGILALVFENGQTSEMQFTAKIMLFLMSASFAFIAVKLDDLVAVLQSIFQH